MQIMDAILVFNVGSTSLKFSLFYPESKKLEMGKDPSCKGLLQSIEKKWQLTLEDKQGKKNIPLQASHLQNAVMEIREFLHFQDVTAIGHRVVHGGDFFKKPILIDSSVVKKIKSLSDLAPLHNPMNVEGIKIAQKIFPKISQVAVFDTSFHSHMPLKNKVYPIPLGYFEEGIKRYGFHGINHQYCMEKVLYLAKNKAKKIITCHLGGGASLAAIANGHSIDTTMGFTPLEGLMMATRSGSIDPGILLHFLETKKMTVKKLKKCLYDQSGLLGIGNSSDMREILYAKSQQDAAASLAFDLYIHYLSKEIASMAASLNGVDSIVFSGGIGENANEVRQAACESLAFLGVKIDPGKNQKCKQDAEISSPSSQVKVFRIAANEEWLIAKEVLELI